MQNMQTVIGGGLAGLTAATAMARRGLPVQLFEHSSHLGGRAITTSLNGFQLNLGPHALYRDGVAMQTLAAWGIKPSGRKPEVGPRHYLSFEHRLYPLPTGPQGLLFSNLFQFTEKWDAMNALRKVSPKGVDPGLSLAEWLEKEVHTSKVKLLLEALTRVSTYVNEPEFLQARAALRQVQLGLSGGVVYLDGGWQTIVDTLEQQALQQGVGIIRNARISDAPEGSILAVPPSQVEALTGAALSKLRAVRTSCLDLGLAELPKQSAQFVLGMDEPMYMSVHSTAAKLSERPRAAVVHVARYLGCGAPASRAELERFADLAMPGWRHRVEAARYLPEMTVTHTAPWVGDPRPETDHIPGVLLAGDWVGSEGMLADCSFASALTAADSALRQNQSKAA